MLKIKFYNLKKIFKHVNKLKTQPVDYPSVFSSIKRMILFFIFFLFITGITALIVVFSFNKSQGIITVPKVVGLNFFNAYQILHTEGFNIDISLNKFNNIARGKVAYQSISEHKKVKKGRKIKLVVSLGTRGIISTDPKKTYELNSYVINFKLPEQYESARVKILVTDNKDTDRLVYDEIISATNKLRLPVKIYGQGIKKIYINDELFIEKDL